MDGTPSAVCVYHSAASDVGDFVGGVKLSSADATALGRLLKAGAGDSADCRPADDYAVVHIEPHWLYVELSGCRRMVLDGGETYTAPVPRLVEAIKELDLQR